MGGSQTSIRKAKTDTESSSSRDCRATVHLKWMCQYLSIVFCATLHATGGKKCYRRGGNSPQFLRTKHSQNEKSQNMAIILDENT